jgi:FlaA1/EpsC-like NDP-sugar epimerase
MNPSDQNQTSGNSLPEIPGKGIRVLLIGGNNDGKQLLELFGNDPSIHVVAVVDKNLKTPAVSYIIGISSGCVHASISG